MFFADQDDRWDIDKIQIMEKILKEHEDCVVLCSDYFPWFFDAHTKEIPADAVKKMDNGNLEKVELSNRSLCIGAIGCCMCIRRNFYEMIEQYWFDGWAQDDRMWRLAQCANGLYMFHSNLVWHRIHSKNTSTYGNYHNRIKRMNLFKNMFLACVQSEKAAEEFHASEEEKKILFAHTSMMKRRCEMLEERKPLYSLGLLKFLKYYQNYRSFLIDLYCLR